MINRIRRAVSSSPHIRPVVLVASVSLGFLSASAQTSDTGRVSEPKQGTAAGHADNAAPEKSRPVVLTQTSDIEEVDLGFAAALLAQDATKFSNLRTEPVLTGVPSRQEHFVDLIQPSAAEVKSR